MGAAEGNPNDAPAPLSWPEDCWDIPPDVIVNGPAFRVPAQTKNNVIEWTYITVPSGFTKDAWVTSMEIRPSQPAVTHHMHVRGKDMAYQLVHTGGRTETILSVPRYDFNWQLGYELAEPVRVTKDTDIVVTAHYDNSVNNKFNPDPNRTVYYGEMVWEEMMHAFLSVLVPKDVEPGTIVGPRN